MSASPELRLQEAVFAHLQQDINVQAVLGVPVRLYDDLPPAPEFPFVSFGRHQSRELDADAPVLMEHTFSMHIWSKYGGKKECQQILDAVRTSLSFVPGNNNDHRVIGVRVIFADVLRAKDGRIFQAIVRLRALTQSTI